MKLRCNSSRDAAFDGLTAEDIRRIRALDTVPAAGRIRRTPSSPDPGDGAGAEGVLPKRKRGVRA